MNTSFLPERFKRFASVISTILEFSPIGYSFVGSYANPRNTPSKYSDLDLVFVFDTKHIFDVYSLIVSKLNFTEDIRVIELGVHYQYGYTICIYYVDNPLQWVDLGIMDESFSRNYMIDFPKKDILGEIIPSNNHQRPLFQMNHLARKIILAIIKEDLLSAKIFAYRYIGWEKVLFKVQDIVNDTKTAQSGFVEDIKTKNDKEILSFVLSDIKSRFVELAPLIESNPVCNYV